MSGDELRVFPTGESIVGLVILLWLAASVVFGLFTAWLAAQKRRSALNWFALAFFFGPLALFTLGFAPDGDEQPHRSDESSVWSGGSWTKTADAPPSGD